MIGKLVGYTRRNAIALLALFVALGGTSYAVSGGFVSVDHKLSGCVGGDGSLRLLRPGHRCGKHQTSVAWSVTGPAGERGAAGPPGAGAQNGQSVTSSGLAAGDANCPFGGSALASASGVTFACNGGPGPSDLYTNKSPGLPINLPAGDYAVFARGTWANGAGSTNAKLHCQVYEFDANLDPIDEGAQFVAAEKPATLTLVGTVHLAEPTELDLTCGVTPTETGSFTSFELTAERAGALHTQ
ncbi:MAG TPA: hypothetical protein VGI52_08950 [Solirubrobacteraceae bacterium]|jgi:hypothetical protein